MVTLRDGGQEGRLSRAWDQKDTQLQGSGRRGRGWPRMVAPRALGVLLLLHLAPGEQWAPHPLLPSLGEPGSGMGRDGEGACPERVLWEPTLTAASPPLTSGSVLLS